MHFFLIIPVSLSIYLKYLNPPFDAIHLKYLSQYFPKIENSPTALKNSQYSV